MSYSALVSGAVLEDHLHNPGWRIFDCRHVLTDPEAGGNAYRKGHLPGAFFLHLDQDLSGRKNGLR